ncbi:MAG: four helix bundle protein [Deltaproteobacteria bacterium]|nr:four helix bundle protein [Deltaproteobacteria bacterium]
MLQALCFKLHASSFKVWNMKHNTFHSQLREKIDKYVHLVYRLTRKLPKEELYGVVSQLRRSALSVMLNYIEGYARIEK